MHQSWGILTGIRPMKLYHKYRREGHSTEEAQQLLMEDIGFQAKRVNYSRKLRMYSCEQCLICTT